MSKSKIEWTERTWSPVTGCTKVSTGCKNCYAEREVDARWSKNPKSVFFGRSFGDVQCHPDQLERPFSWRKPQKIFVCPRADLFHEAVPDDFILSVFDVMRRCTYDGGANRGRIRGNGREGHVFQVLTKRPARMRDFVSRLRWDGEQLTLDGAGRQFVSRGVWLGVTVENQAAADERIPLLLQTPAVVRWASVEPMVGPIDFTVLPNSFSAGEGQRYLDALRGFVWYATGPDYIDTCGIGAAIDWVVVGGESGKNARVVHPDWIRSLRDQCAAARVPFFFKQWGQFVPAGQVAPVPLNGEVLGNATKKAAGRLLDGGLHHAYPQLGQTFQQTEVA